MKILILKDEKAFREVSRTKIVESFFCGYWKDGIFKVEKDRLNGLYDYKTPEALVAYLGRMQEDYERSRSSTFT